jgi:hypothetical protein
MTPLRHALAMLLLVICVLLAAGCISQPAAENPNTNASDNTTAPLHMTTQATIPPIQNSRESGNDETYWIKIDPIGDHVVGDKVLVTGITNLPIGDEIIVDIYPATFAPTEKERLKADGTEPTPIKVMKGMTGNNTWVYRVFDTTHSKKDTYLVTAISITNHTTTTQLFNLSSAPL